MQERDREGVLPGKNKGFGCLWIAQGCVTSLDREMWKTEK